MAGYKPNIDTPEARARLEGLPWLIRDDIVDMRTRIHALRQLILGCENAGNEGKARAYRQRLDIHTAALNAAIVAAFEPLTAPDQSEQVARIIGGDA